MGFATEGRKPSADGGVDMVAVSTQPLLSGRYIVQCKRYSHSVSSPIIRDLYGVVMSERANKGILITTSTFTSDAVEFARDKPIELIDGDSLLGLLERYSLLPSLGLEQPSTEKAPLMLRNEIAGLANKFSSRLTAIDSHLVLDKKSFGNEFQMNTYRSFEAWTKQLQHRKDEELQAMRNISQQVINLWNTASPDSVQARQIRTQLEELLEHMIVLYDEIKRTEVPRVLMEYEKALTTLIRGGIVNIITYVKNLDETIENGKTPFPYEPTTEGVEDIKRAIDQGKAGILRVFHGRGAGHHLRKLQGGRFSCSCGLELPNRDEAIAHTNPKYLGK